MSPTFHDKLIISNILPLINLARFSDKLSVEELLTSPEYKAILGDEVRDRLLQLGKISDDPKSLQRTFMSPAWAKTAIIVRKWMEEAGMKA